MSDSRIIGIRDLLLRYQSGQAFEDFDQENACRQLAARLDRKHPGALQSGASAEVLTELIASDYVARELAHKIEPIPESLPNPSFSTARLLFLSAWPNDTDALGLQREVRDILEALKLSSRKEKLCFEEKGAVRIAELHRHIVDFEPDIVHFSGHGEEGAILLEDAIGERVRVASSELAELFDILDQKVRCVVLNACETGLDAEPLAETVGVVVVRDGSVPDSAAIVFSTFFYEGLARGWTPRRAFKLACWQVKKQTPFGECLPRLLGASLDVPFLEIGS